MDFLPATFAAFSAPRLADLFVFVLYIFRIFLLYFNIGQEQVQIWPTLVIHNLAKFFSMERIYVKYWQILRSFGSILHDDFLVGFYSYQEGEQLSLLPKINKNNGPVGETAVLSTLQYHHQC